MEIETERITIIIVIISSNGDDEEPRSCDSCDRPSGKGQRVYAGTAVDSRDSRYRGDAEGMLERAPRFSPFSCAAGFEQISPDNFSRAGSPFLHGVSPRGVQRSRRHRWTNADYTSIRVSFPFGDRIGDRSIKTGGLSRARSRWRNVARAAGLIRAVNDVACAEFAEALLPRAYFQINRVKLICVLYRTSREFHTIPRA